MKKVLAICMALVLVVALPLAVSADTHVSISIDDDGFYLFNHWYIDADGIWNYDVGSASIVDSNVYLESDNDYYGCGFSLSSIGGKTFLTIDQYQSFSVSFDIKNYDASQRPLVNALLYLYTVGGGYLQVPYTSTDYDGATATLTVNFSGAFDLSRDLSIYRIGLTFRYSAPCVADMYYVCGDLDVVTEVTDPDAYYTEQIIDQIQTSTDEITGSIDDSTGQIVGELDEIQSDIKGDDWTSPAPGKDDELNGAMSDYDDAYNEAVGGKSDQEIVDEVSGQVDYDYGALDQQSVSGVTGFLSDLLDSFGADYKSLLMLSLTIGLAVYVIGRRVSSA